MADNDNQWDSVSTLSVIITGNLQGCNIYANSQNMIGVTVSIQPTNKKANPVQVDADHLAANTWLIDYNTQSKLSWKGSSGWCYTDTPNEYTAIPSGSRAAEVTTSDNGVQQVTFYVSCSPDASTNKAIGILVRTDTGKNIYSSQNGQFHNSVSFATLSPFTYKKGDISWTHEPVRLSTGSGPYDYVHNYYLSCAKGSFYFKKFEAHYYCRDAGYEGFFGWDVEPQCKQFIGVYIWPDEPHRQASKTIVNFPGDWSEQVTIYNKDDLTNSRSLCFTWATNYHGGGGYWHLPNGPMTALKQFYHTWVVVYDQYGNSGTFWPDGKEIIPWADPVGGAAETVTETSPGLFTVHTDSSDTEARPASAPSDTYGPRIDIYDYNPNP